jgi:parvulin-like peptidyl-prolyl isomerase
MTKKNPYLFNLLILLALIVLVACGDGGSEGEGITLDDVSPVETDSPPIAPTPLLTIVPTSLPLPTATPQLAALVNGQPILLEEYEKELARYELAQAELEIDSGENGNDYHDFVLDALIERELIQQAAVVQGVTISPDTIDLKMNELRESASEHGTFDDWLIANLWTEEEFQNALEAELIVEKMVAAITIDVPTAMEQVHVRYIQVDNSDLAQSLLGQLREDSDFADLAQRYSLDQTTAPYGGDLGFFARGSLLVPEVETVAFSLQLGEVSDVISVTDPDSGLITYYIVKLIDRDPNRMLGADLRYRLLQEAFGSWLEEQKMGATITKFLEIQG